MTKLPTRAINILTETDMIRTRRHLSFKSMFGNKMELNNNPDMNPNTLAKLSIIGKKPTNTRSIKVAVNFRNTSHG